MTRNPYAQIDSIGGDPNRPGGYGGPGDYGDGQPPRTSALAVASLVVSIVSLIVCCVPGPGVLGMFLALGAVISISRSQGRRTGLGMAIAGLLIGLIATIISLLIWIAIWMGMSGITAHRDTLAAIWQRDAATVAPAFEPAAAALITPERLEAFVQEVESEMGAYKDVPRGLGGLWVGYSRVGPSLDVSGQQGYQGQLIPVPAEFDNGYAAVLLDVPPGVSPMAGGPAPSLRNIGIILPRARRVVWLVDPAAIPPATTPPALPGPAGTPPAAPTPDADDGAAPAPDSPAAPEPAEPSEAPDSPPAPPDQPAPPADPDPAEPAPAGDPAGGGS